jgi:hypothetical protein
MYLLHGGIVSNSGLGPRTIIDDDTRDRIWVLLTAVSHGDTWNLSHFIKLITEMSIYPDIKKLIDALQIKDLFTTYPPSMREFTPGTPLGAQISYFFNWAGIGDAKKQYDRDEWNLIITQLNNQNNKVLEESEFKLGQEVIIEIRANTK